MESSRSTFFSTKIIAVIGKKGEEQIPFKVSKKEREWGQIIVRAVSERCTNTK